MNTPDIGRPPIELPDEADRLVDQGVGNYFYAHGNWGNTNEPPTPTETGRPREAVPPDGQRPRGMSGIDATVWETEHQPSSVYTRKQLARYAREGAANARAEVTGADGKNKTKPQKPSVKHTPPGKRSAAFIQAKKEAAEQQPESEQGEPTALAQAPASHTRVAAYRQAKLAAQEEQSTVEQNE